MTTDQRPPTITLEDGLTLYLASLEGANKSPATIGAYRIDLTKFINWLHETALTVIAAAQVSDLDITDYLTYLSQRRLTGVSRGRKLSAIREYFRFLKRRKFIEQSPADDIDTPKPGKYGRVHLQEDEYTKLLALAGGNTRDYAILQVFLQTGIRVAELCSLTLTDIDLINRTIFVRSGKGLKDRQFTLAPKAVIAIKNYLKERGNVPHGQLFLNYTQVPISKRGVEKLIVKYRRLAGIQKKVTCHSLRHTFATQKARQGVPAFQLQQWLGHEDLRTTQLYVHLAEQDDGRLMEATSL
jgi:site-specific recombinase XerD